MDAKFMFSTFENPREHIENNHKTCLPSLFLGTSKLHHYPHIFMYIKINRLPEFPRGFCNLQQRTVFERFGSVIQWNLNQKNIIFVKQMVTNSFTRNARQICSGDVSFSTSSISYLKLIVQNNPAH